MPKVALLTGVRRIGFYIAQYLLTQGYDLAVLYKTSEIRIKELKDYAESLGRKVIPFKVDLTVYESYRDVPLKVFQILGRIDVLLNIASPFGKKDFFEVSPDDLDFYYSSILKAGFILAQESARFMLKNSSSLKGRIVNFGDWATVSGNPYKNFSPYLVAKGGLDTLTEVLAVELAPYILVNEIALGPVLPPMLEGKEKNDHWEKYVKEKTLLGRPVEIGDILSAVDFFLKTKTVTGEILSLDSGQRFVGKGY
ncbi:MAG TPA: SDR family oxidoreductase [Aquifex aeolicus]|nr:SDR family oxidoreductase [Aquificales bacterium]HIQ26622.1 SDR family oxidoreductase [Aquifex aeolicus]